MITLSELAKLAGWPVVETRINLVTIEHTGERFSISMRNALTDRVVMRVAGYDEDSIRTYPTDSLEVTVSAGMTPEKIIKDLTRRMLENSDARQVARTVRESHAERMAARQYLRDAIRKFGDLGFLCPDLRDGDTGVPLYEYTSVKLYKSGCPSVTLYANGCAQINVRSISVEANKLVESMDALRALSPDAY